MPEPRAITGGLLAVTGEFPPGPGGIGVHMYHIALELHRLGVPVCVFCPSTNAAPEEISAFDSRSLFRTVRYGEEARGILSRRLQARQLRKLCRIEKPACLMASGERAAWLVHRVAADLQLPWIVKGHGSEFLEPRRRRLQRTQRAFAAADRIIVDTRYTAGLIARLGISGDRIQIVLPGADHARTNPDEATVDALRRRMGLVGKRVILTVGRVSPRKAQDVVIRAMPEILKRFPEAVYLLVGLPAAWNEFSALARELGVADRVISFGVASDGELAAFYRLCDLFILNSRTTPEGSCEGFGMVLVEAALAGRPVIATRGCGAEEAVAEGVTGLLVRPDDPQETAQAAIRILSGPDLAKRLGESGRIRALREFTWERSAHEVREVLRRWIP